MKCIRETEQMTDYLRDESRSTGSAEAVFFPETEVDVVGLMRQYPDVPVTIQGSRTGLTGGCVPEGGIVLNMSRMSRILSLQPGCCMARVQPGLALQALRDALQGTGLWFPPDPTETSASIGGMIANDSSGARTYKYRSMREHVRAIRVVLRDGSVLRLRRSGDRVAEAIRRGGSPGAPDPSCIGAPEFPYSGAARACGLEYCLRTEGGRVLRGRLPDVPMPQVSKNVAGYHIRPDMDLIDLFIGSEGTLGIVTEAELLLRKRPGCVWGCMVFLRTEEQVLAFVEAIRGQEQAEAIEYFDRDVLDLMRRAQEAGEVLQEAVPVPAERCAVYVEYAAETRAEMLRIFSPVNRTILSVGGDTTETWLAINAADLNKLKGFRHAAPVCVNHVIAETKKEHPAITKLGTDMSVPNGCLQQVFRMYREGLAGGCTPPPGQTAQASHVAPQPSASRPFRSAVFGHIGNNHVHVNILPRDEEEYARGKALYAEWAREVVAMGGSVSAEHGIGKLKKWLLAEMYDERQREQLRTLRRVFDPEETLGRGNLI